MRITVGYGGDFVDTYRLSLHSDLPERAVYK